jgi:hypothetical protein
MSINQGLQRSDLKLFCGLMIGNSLMVRRKFRTGRIGNRHASLKTTGHHFYKIPKLRELKKSKDKSNEIVKALSGTILASMR